MQCPADRHPTIPPAPGSTHLLADSERAARDVAHAQAQRIHQRVLLDAKLLGDGPQGVAALHHVRLADHCSRRGGVEEDGTWVLAVGGKVRNGGAAKGTSTRPLVKATLPAMPTIIGGPGGAGAQQGDQQQEGAHGGRCGRRR